MPADQDELCIRPPWRDELPRLKSLLRQESVNPPGGRPLVLVARDPERLVGAAVLTAAGQTGILACRLRPRVILDGRAAPFIDAVIYLAREEGLTRLQIAVPPSSPERSFWEEQGFEFFASREQWQIGLGGVKARLERLERRREIRPEWLARALSEADRAGLDSWLESHQAANTATVDSQPTPGASVLRPDLSTVIEEHGRLLAALLVRERGGAVCHVDLLTVTPEIRGGVSLLCEKLLRRSTREMLRQGYGAVTATIVRPDEIAARNLANRCGGKVTGKTLLLTRKLQASDA